MSSANSSGQIPIRAASASAAPSRTVAESDARPERLHWALRLSFQALIKPSVWFRAH